MKTIYRSILFIICLNFSLLSSSQSTRFRTYTESEGLCHSFIYSINQDKNGYIWISTGKGLCKFDGFSFYDVSTTYGTPNTVANVSFKDSFEKLWFGFNNGEVWSYDGVEFKKHIVMPEKSVTITGISELYTHDIIISTQNNGLYLINGDGIISKFKGDFDNKLITTIHARGDALLIGTQQGLMYYHLILKKSKFITELNELQYYKIQSIKSAYSETSYLLGTEDAGLYYFDTESNKAIKKINDSNKSLEFENIQDAIYDVDSNLWVCSYTSGLMKLTLGNENQVSKIEKINKSNGLLSNFAKTVFQDREKNIWLGTYGGGFYLSANDNLNFEDYSNSIAGNDITSIAESDDALWFTTDRALVKANPDLKPEEVFTKIDGLPNDQLTALAINQDEIWVGTKSNGIFHRKKSNEKFRVWFKKNNTISNSINNLLFHDKKLYVATKNGIFIKKTDRTEELHFNTVNGLPHNDIKQLYLDKENNLLFATRANGIYKMKDSGEVEEIFSIGKFELDFNSIASDSKGNLWAGTYGQGVFLMSKDTVTNITDNEGLYSNYCYSIVASDNNNIWIGHRLGISKINTNNLNITVFDSDNGITGDCNPNSVAHTSDNKIIFGTTSGFVEYNISDHIDSKLAPKANIQRIIISGKEYKFDKEIQLPYDAYKVKIEYIGLYYSDPKSVKYRYKLEGHDLDWSELTSSKHATYQRLEDGDYKFLLKAYSNGVEDELPINIFISIKKPIWKTWWFITILLALVAAGIVLIIKYREKKQKRIQEYLEKRLDERTREVVMQKEVIEIKNKDITDSIKYAQRIQTSILPPIIKLQQHLSGSFIFFQPRDIVSGDFYWFDITRNNKLIIACADSTGHGVPGAFMSMIGTTLLKDICLSNEALSPSEILSQLNAELLNTLNKTVDSKEASDGMDMVICEIDLDTHYMRYSSAMRPMIVIKNGEQIYLKGSRSTIGGYYDSGQDNFKNNGIQLEKGDLVYMFTDGYPDQFGGPMGKKLKMVRLKNLLKDIYPKPMEEQYEYVKSTFNLWKENHEQVDDVLVMGIKI